MKIKHATTVLAVSDLENALGFYTRVLGFREELRFDFYAGVRRDDCRIGLSARGDPRQREPGTGEVYIVCDAVDDWHHSITSAGAAVDAPPDDQDHGMREFTVHDPDGNRISFGTPLGGPNQALQLTGNARGLG